MEAIKKLAINPSEIKNDDYCDFITSVSRNNAKLNDLLNMKKYEEAELLATEMAMNSMGALKWIILKRKSLCLSQTKSQNEQSDSIQ